eukprot:4852340-Pyramimonas_sp.AAC.1
MARGTESGIYSRNTAELRAGTAWIGAGTPRRAQSAPRPARQGPPGGGPAPTWELRAELRECLLMRPPFFRWAMFS